MAPRLRRMKPYRPRRRRSKAPDGNKQALKDYKHKLSSDVGSLIVLIREGNKDQVSLAQQKAKSDFLKYSQEMQKVAQKLGDRVVKSVREYLDSVDSIVHTQADYIDEEKVRYCRMMEEKLDREIAA